MKKIRTVTSTFYVLGGMLLGVCFEHMGPDAGGYFLVGVAGFAIVMFAAFADFDHGMVP